MTTATQRDTVTEFFPTPGSVISRMIAPVADRLATSTILEPSAGKGDILDRLTSASRVHKDNVYAIEANPELQFVLAGKGYRVLDSDFLAFNEPYRFDVIIMNPPFSAGADHALKAWEIVAPGGAVVCLLNAETLRNPYTAKRQLLADVVRQHGRQESLGPVFKGAARATDIDVTMIVLTKPEAERLGVFEGVTFDTDAPERENTFSAAPLAHRDMLQSLVDQYNAVVALIKQRHDLTQQIEYHTKALPKPSSRPAITALNEQLQEVKGWFWSYIFERTRLGSVATSKAQAEFEQMRQQNTHMAFSIDNITAVLDLLMLNYGEIITGCIVDVFDQVTQFHEKNTVHTEGWKTNKSWKIARKIIVPWGVSYDKWGWSLAHMRRDFYDDLDKACCFLSGTDYTSLRKEYRYGEATPSHLVYDAITDHIHGKTGLEWNEPFDSEFFTLRVYKKGTVHLVFKDETLWTRFNEAAARGKKWVGAGY